MTEYLEGKTFLFIFVADMKKMKRILGSMASANMWKLTVLPVFAIAMMAATSADFDFSRYHKAMLEKARVRYPQDTCEIRFKEYCLIDIDGDGRAEIWVRGDDCHEYQGVFALGGDSVAVLAESDSYSELSFHKGAVSFDGFYGEGRTISGASKIRRSCRVSTYYEEVKVNAFGEDEEVEYENYVIDGRKATALECLRFRESLGDTIRIIHPIWFSVE